MFTGLVETIGTVVQKINAADSMTLTIEASPIMDDGRVGDSIAVNGCCLTIIRCNTSQFDVTIVHETLSKTTLGTLTHGSAVNLERAMKLGDRLGGHLVSGHVDCVGTVTEVTNNVAGTEVWIGFPVEYRPNVIPVGSVCVDGVSLTVADISDNVLSHSAFKVAIIPHTLEVTTLTHLTAGSTVNLEFDLIGKYALQSAHYSR